MTERTERSEGREGTAEKGSPVSDPLDAGYSEGHLQQLLAEDARVAELGIRVVRLQQGGFALHGEVESPERRTQIERVVAESFPDLPIRCEIAITRTHAPEDVEEL